MLNIVTVWHFRFCGFDNGIVRNGVCVAEHIEKPVKRLLAAFFVFQLALPNNNNIPPELVECFYIAHVPDAVFVDFFLPKFSVGFWHTIIFTVFVAVPKAAMNKYYGLEPTHHNVGRAGKFFIVQTITPTHTVKIATHKHFRLGVYTADSSHIAATFFGCLSICHGNSMVLYYFNGGRVGISARAERIVIRHDAFIFAVSETDTESEYFLESMISASGK